MKTIKLLSLIIVLLGSITSGSIWAATRGGGGHGGGGGDHHAVSGQIAGGSHFSAGQTYAGGLQIARRGGRSFRGGRKHFGWGRHFGRGFYGRGFGRHGFGWGFGLGYGMGYGRYWPYYGGYGYGGWPYYGGYGYGGYPPVTYIQQENGAQAAIESQTNYWHYCSNPEGYYPYVKKCPDGWLPVAPQPTASTVVIAPTAPTTQ